MANAEIGGALSGTVTEDTAFDVYGAVFVSGSAATTSFISGVFAGLYGSLTIATTGDWHYALSNNLTTVQSLGVNSESHDNFAVSLADGSLQSVVDISVRGVNDAATFGGDLSKNLGVRAATSVSGKAEVYDLDNGEKEFQPLTQTGSLGTLTLTKDGSWQYDLLPGSQTAVLDESKNVTDVFSIFSKDGTRTEISVFVSADTAPINGTVNADQLLGTSGNDTINALAGNDSLNGRGGDDSLDGGSGLDVALYAGARAGFTISRAIDNSVRITDSTGSEGGDTLVNVERLRFSDKALALDIDGNGGQAYRLYQAAFNRAPDLGGLGYWIYQMDNGMSLLQVSQGFFDSNEFRSVYGQDPTEAQLVTRFYNNVLHRDPEQGGYDYWMGQLQSGQTRMQVLVGFSESNENQANVIGVIQNGFEYTLQGA